MSRGRRIVTCDTECGGNLSNALSSLSARFLREVPREMFMEVLGTVFIHQPKVYAEVTLCVSVICGQNLGVHDCQVGRYT